MFELGDKNSEFAKGLGNGLRYTSFLSLSEDLRTKILDLAEKNSEFGNEFGFTLGENYPSLTNDQEKIWKRTEENSEFGNEFGFTLGENYPYLKDDLKSYIIFIGSVNHHHEPEVVIVIVVKRNVCNTWLSNHPRMHLKPLCTY